MTHLSKATHFRFYPFILAFAFLSSFTSAHAQSEDAATDSAPSVHAPDPDDANTGGAGDLLVAPTRIVLEGRKRAGEVTLNNKGGKEATYRISLIQQHMDEAGKYTEFDVQAADTLGEKPAAALLRYSPHQVTLKPGESQTIKIMARIPQDLADGEYRSHLLFRAVPESASGVDVEAPPVAPGQISIRLTPIYGVSIPVIIRHGALSAQAKLTGARLSGNTLSLTVERSGNKSLFGDLFAHCGDKTVGELRGVAVLLPNSKRQISLPLESPCAHPHIEYRAREENESAVLATTEVK